MIKKLSLFACFTLLVMVSCKENQRLLNDWANFKVEFNKSYPNLGVETLRRKIWLDNMVFIERHNFEAEEKGLHTYRLQMNAFGDMVSSCCLLKSINFFKNYQVTSNSIKGFYLNFAQFLSFPLTLNLNSENHWFRNLL
jgi:hypothetical protein